MRSHSVTQSEKKRKIAVLLDGFGKPEYTEDMLCTLYGFPIEQKNVISTIVFLVC